MQGQELKGHVLKDIVDRRAAIRVLISMRQQKSFKKPRSLLSFFVSYLFDNFSISL